MIRIEKKTMLGSQQTFMKLSRSEFFADYILLDMVKKGFKERAINEFERMAKMERCQP